jgi:protein-tyrosine phosphatase
MNHKILFICTGNYYRSRFAEMLFNALAARLGLPWQADSRGIATEFGTGNIGPISPLVLQKLQALGVPIEADIRAPIRLEESDLEHADLIIALNEPEHGPLITKRFAPWADQIVYWNVPDLHWMKAEDALALIENNITALVQQVQNHSSPQS